MKTWKSTYLKRGPLALATLFLIVSAAGCGAAIPTRPDVNVETSGPAASPAGSSTVRDGGDNRQETPDGSPSIGVPEPTAGETGGSGHKKKKDKKKNKNK